MDKDIKNDLENISIQTNRSMSELIREMLRNELPKYQSVNKKEGVKLLKNLAKNAVEGPGDSDYDRYAY